MCKILFPSVATIAFLYKKGGLWHGRRRDQTFKVSWKKKASLFQVRQKTIKSYVFTGGGLYRYVDLLIDWISDFFFKNSKLVLYKLLIALIA